MPELFLGVSLAQAVFIFAVALLAGLINSFAGGGSFISFPALLVTGISPIAANATSSLGLLPGTMGSAIGYRNALTPQARRLLPSLLVTGVIGGTIGAGILLVTPSATFMHIVPWMLLSATLIFIFSGRLMTRMNLWVVKRHQGSAADGLAQNRAPRALIVVGLVLQLILAIYVGYFGAGVGILMLALLAFLGLEDIHAMNGVKSVVITAENGIAVITFILAHAIVWPQAMVMLIGAALGGYGGAHLAQKMNPRHVRYVVIAIGFVMSAYFFVKY